MSVNMENSFDTDIDDGGSFSFYRFGVNGSAEKIINDRNSINFNIDYSLDSFDFSGSSGFASMDPWDDIHKTGIGMRYTHRFNEKWSFVASPKVTFAGESGSQFSKGLTYRGIGGFTYSFSKDLVIGTGIIATTRIEDDFIAFPGAIVNWRINKRLILSSILSDVRTEMGPRLTLNYILNRDISGSLSLGYEFRRFRLDDEGVAPDGVGDIKLLPVWLTISYALTDYARLEIYTGTSFFGEMEIEDRNGDRIRKEDFDSLIFIGAGVKLEL